MMVEAAVAISLGGSHWFGSLRYKPTSRPFRSGARCPPHKVTPTADRSTVPSWSLGSRWL